MSVNTIPTIEVDVTASLTTLQQENHRFHSIFHIPGVLPPKWHAETNYKVLHPQTRLNIQSRAFRTDKPYMPHFRLLNYRIIERRSDLTPISKYLSFRSEADLISYVNVVVPDIVGPALDFMSSGFQSSVVKKYADSSFAWESIHDGNVSPSELAQLFNAASERGHYFSKKLDPIDIAVMYFLSKPTQDLVEFLVSNLSAPKLIPVTKICPPDRPDPYGDGIRFCSDLFILVHAIQILLFAPTEFRANGSHKTTDSYTRRFPLGFPAPRPDDPKVLGVYSDDDLLRAILLMFLLMEQRTALPLACISSPPPQPSGVWLGYTKTRTGLLYPNYNPSSTRRESFPFMRLPEELQIRIIELAISSQITPCIQDDQFLGSGLLRAIQMTTEDTILPLKLSCRHIYRLIKVSLPVDAVDKYGQVIFRIDFKRDILRTFAHQIPVFHDREGQIAPLPVRKPLMVCSEENYEGAAPNDYVHWDNECPFETAIALDRLPLLEEFNLILQVAESDWRIEGLQREGPQIDIHRHILTDMWGRDRWNNKYGEAAAAYEEKRIPAHTGIKWKFNYYRYYDLYDFPDEEESYLGVPPGFCDDEDVEMSEAADPRCCIPYIGFYGYDRGQASMGGNWAGFRCFEETNEVYFTPLAWTDVEPLVMGPHGENGREAVWDEHHPQFVARLWIIRKGQSVPEGQGQYAWMRVDEASQDDPDWKHQLMNTWKVVWSTLSDGPDEYNYPGCSYEFHQR
ncbi:hypothetical protein F53441_6020 [Fusarium austroafricanum]|uniref:Uncharacterized protein n=1 Tax=Fusarium austroafricanum TaxID=2364996 RepID=A0A8H4NTU8_9HYPO|nr:hypothetical protein F53441_6020 [Fusarium austroafricanum]